MSRQTQFRRPKPVYVKRNVSKQKGKELTEAILW